MAGRKCAECDIVYPPDFRFDKCPLHGTSTTWGPHLVQDELWEWKAEQIRQTEERAKPARIPPLADVTPVQDEQGQWWIASADLIRAGIHSRLEDLSVIELPSVDDPEAPCECLWEIQAYSESRRAYWVRPLRVPDGP